MPTADPSLSLAERVDAACDAFERDWRAGRNPRVEDFVAAATESDRDALRSALVAVEAELNARRAAGETSVSGESVRTGSHPGPTVARPADQSAVPNRIGRFEIRAALGSGAFGRVYRAYDPSLDREVAIKVPVADTLPTPADRDRFLKEARAAATVSHPNVCPIHEIGEHEGQPYIVMALVPGQSLADVLRSRKEPVPEKQAAIMVRKIALALDAAHKKGVVHRDLKPANVMFDKERKDLVVMDFGLARKAVSGSARDTQSGVVMGTPAYMSPEQARGDAKDVGPEGDIFSLGIIMYELLTGERPFTGTAHEVIGQILLLDPMPPSARREGIDPQLEAICLKAMAKDPAKRFASMKDFAAAVDGVLRQRASASAETARAADTDTKPDGDTLSTDRRKLAEVFDAMSEERKTSKAETAAAREETVAMHHTTRWIVVAVALLVGVLSAAVAAVVFFTQNDKVKVTVELKGIDLNDTTLTFILDDKPISAEALKQPVELKPGDHILVVQKSNAPFKRFKIVVTGGRTPGMEAREEPDAPVMVPPVDPKIDPNTGPGGGPKTEVEEGFVSLFNGKDLTGWEAKTRPEAFAVDPNGYLTAKGDTPAGRVHWLLTKKEYTDYVLRLEFQFALPLPTGTNSAIAIRSPTDGPAVRPQRLKVELRNLDRPPQKTGALVYTVGDAVEPAKPVGQLATGEWHKLELEVRGAQVKVMINGKLVNDVDMTKIDRTLLSKNEKWAEAELDRRKGHIGIQSWRNPIKFRNIRVKELTGEVIVPAPKTGPSDGWKGLEAVKTLPHAGVVTDAVFTPDGSQLLTACSVGEPPPPDYGGVFAWDAKTWKQVGKPIQLTRVAKLAPNKGNLVIGLNGNGGLGVPSRAEFVVWNTSANKTETKFSFDGDNPGGINSLEVLPDGKRALASRYNGDNHLTAIFDIATGEYKLKVKGFTSCLLPVKAGKNPTILVADGAELKEIEIATEKVVRTLKGHTEFIQCLAVSSDGRFAASASSSRVNEIYLWDLSQADGTPVLLGKQKAHAYCLAFSPNGKSLVSGSAEGVLKLWDVIERKEVAAVRADEKFVWSVRFSPDGGQVVAGCQEEKAAKVWKLTK